MYSKIIQNLIAEFSKFPGIGPKTAEKFVFYLAKKDINYLENFIKKIISLKNIKTCKICGNYTEKEICDICSNPKRDHSVICVVAKPQDLVAIEKTGEYNGVYHILYGLIDQSKNIGPEKLKIKELIQRIKTEKVKELILALNPSLEGEITILYLKKILKPLKIKITQLARGLPMGSDLEYADEITLSSALKNRKQI
ncbi:recombination protein RecR [bacterium]|nr:recombination protein RecR [bacterium]